MICISNIRITRTVVGNLQIPLNRTKYNDLHQRHGYYKESVTREKIDTNNIFLC
jgi:hypothetical protein